MNIEEKAVQMTEVQRNTFRDYQLEKGMRTFFFIALSTCTILPLLFLVIATFGTPGPPSLLDFTMATIMITVFPISLLLTLVFLIAWIIQLRKRERRDFEDQSDTSVVVE